MKNLKVAWPTLLAIALAVSITSCHNNKLVEDYEKSKLTQSVPTFEQVFTPTEEEIPQIEVEEPKGFSK